MGESIGRPLLLLGCCALAVLLFAGLFI